ncbi:MAG: argininosuccinate synthase [Gemmatimonadota bacterium]|nr:argininosuccinate synthase [Gemmatimonadota bacterium]
MSSRQVRKVALAFSGGLDTSVAVPWLKETYGAQVVCVVVDVGQGGEDLDEIEERAHAAGAEACHVVDVREEFVTDFVWPTLRAGAVYGRKYLLGTAMARPLIAREVVRAARREDCDALAHGCTGKGNDQVRFELTFGRLAPDLTVIAPWREWDIRGRADAERYGRSVGVPLPPPKTSVYSRDRNVWHVSHEGGPLENPANAPEEDMFLLTVDPSDGPAEGERVEITFEAGTPVAVNGRALTALQLLETLNEIGGRHGVGRVDLIEDRIVGLKSRGVYETPGGTLLHVAHNELEHFVLDRRTLELKDSAALRYATLVYEGRWWGTEKKALDALIDVTQERVTGSIALRVCRGTIAVAARESALGLYAEEYATFEASDLYDHSDATGFIRLFGLSYRIQGHGDLIPVEPPSEKAAAGSLPEGDWLD